MTTESSLLPDRSPFRGLVETSLEGIAITADGKIIDANQRLADIFACRLGDLIGASVADLIPAGERARVLQKIAAGIETLVEHEIVRSDGSGRQVETHGRTVEHGGKSYRITAIRDITEGRRMAAALRESELQYRILFETMPVGVVFQDSAGRIISMNPAADRILGKTLEEMRGQTSTSLDHQTIRPDGSSFPGTEHPAMVSLRTGTEVRGVVMGVYNPRERDYRWISVNAVPLFRAGSDQPHQVYTTFEDVTERRRAEHKLQEERRIFDSILTSTDMMLVYLDSEFNFVAVNAAYAETCRTRPEEMVGRNHFELYPHPENEEIFRRVRDSGEPAFFKDKPFVFPDQPERGVTYWDWSLVPVKDAAGKAAGLVFSLRETTRQKRAEEALRLAMAAAEDANRAKDQFLAVLSHELRNPLAPIHNSVMLMKHLGVRDPAFQRAHGIIERQVNQLARLVDDLLDVSRIAMGKIVIQKQGLDLCEVVKSAVEDHRRLLEASGLAVTFVSAPERVFVSGDRDRISQVIGNLLLNAGKFTDSGGHIRVEICTEEQAAIITVTDTGVGMDAATLGRLFEPFAQADSSLHRSRGGLGLGLALAKGIVGLHGGEIRADSGGIGQGSQFRVRLPILLSDRGEVSVTSHTTQPAQPVRILLIEDNYDSAESMRMILEIFGHQVFVAHTGREGIEQARCCEPGVILCDIGLPELDGFSVARALRREPRLSSVYLVAMTGYGQEQDRQQAFEAGFDHHITKPADIDQLQKLLQARSRAASPPQ